MRAFQVALALRVRNPLNGSFGNTRGAAMARASRRQRERATARLTMLAELARRGGAAGYLPCLVVVTRVAPSGGLDPFDGLPASLKSVVDGVADALGLANDRDPRVEWRAEQLRGERGRYAVLVHITPRSELITPSVVGFDHAPARRGGA